MIYNYLSYSEIGLVQYSLYRSLQLLGVQLYFWLLLYFRSFLPEYFLFSSSSPSKRFMLRRLLDSWWRTVWCEIQSHYFYIICQHLVAFCIIFALLGHWSLSGIVPWVQSEMKNQSMKVHVSLLFCCQITSRTLISCKSVSIYFLPLTLSWKSGSTWQRTDAFSSPAPQKVFP